MGRYTPACSIFVLGLLLMVVNNSYNLRPWVLNEVFLYVVSAALSYLLIAEIPMFSFKFKSLTLKGNRIRVSFLLVIGICLVGFQLGAALSLIILCYVLVSVVLWMGGALKREKRAF